MHNERTEITGRVKEHQEIDEMFIAQLASFIADSMLLQESYMTTLDTDEQPCHNSHRERCAD